MKTSYGRRLLLPTPDRPSQNRVSPPTVSVCIRAFERPDGLRRAIASALAQEFTDLEVVVSDDSGRLRHVADSFDDPRVRYHANPAPAGSLANIRTALGLARGQFLALLDDDDYWLPGFLSEVLPRFDRDERLGIVSTGWHYDVAGRLLASRQLMDGQGKAPLHHILERSFPPCTTVIRTEVWEQGEAELPLEEPAIGDMTLWLRAADAGWAFEFVPSALVVIGVHREQTSWGKQIPRKVIGTLERFRFADPRAERLRLARLSEAWLAEANLALWRGQPASAVRAVAWSRKVAPARFGVRDVLALSGIRAPLARWLSHHPYAFSAGLTLWQRLRPQVTA